MKEIEEEKEEAEKRIMLERVKGDLSRCAAGYEAGRTESMNKDQVQIMEEKVRLMKELQRDLEEQPNQVQKSNPIKYRGCNGGRTFQ